jgi:hypothetical protein
MRNNFFQIHEKSQNTTETALFFGSFWYEPKQEKSDLQDTLLPALVSNTEVSQGSFGPCYFSFKKIPPQVTNLHREIF